MDMLQAGNDIDKQLQKFLGIDTDASAFAFTSSLTAAFILLHYAHDKDGYTYIITNNDVVGTRVDIYNKAGERLGLGLAASEALAISRAFNDVYKVVDSKGPLVSYLQQRFAKFEQANNKE